MFGGFVTNSRNRSFQPYPVGKVKGVHRLFQTVTLLSQPLRLHNPILFVLHIFRFSEIGIVEHSFPCVYNKLVNL